jgi:GNAT superfamily N-acetyltransferase
MMQITVRRASTSDTEELVPLVRSYRAFYEQPADEAGERRFLLKHLRDRSSTIFFARLDNQAAGFAQIFESWSTVRLAPVLSLEDLFVVEALRERGVATELINASLAFARESGAAAMFLETAAGNARAQSVYEREGWRRELAFVKFNAPL